MAHVFSVEIHDYLSEKILQAEQGKKTVRTVEALSPGR